MRTKCYISSPKVPKKVETNFSNAKSHEFTDEEQRHNMSFLVVGIVFFFTSKIKTCKISWIGNVSRSDEFSK